MRFQEVSPDRTLLVELAFDEPLLAELAALVEAADLESAWVLGSGAVREAALASYDQDDFAVESVHFAEPLEMPAFTGTVTAEDRRVRAVLSRPSGQALAGRLDSATVFGGEALVWGFEEPLKRERDEATGLDRLAL
ncbi:MAG: PPC domain-containing DNA-binding protein [Halodesulfurarchaeum sp.]